ncbi:hypothetical protein EON73_04795 [bacterium]|nr:MAG: hypothetical protein EON73_04795 [bacterium]
MYQNAYYWIFQTLKKIKTNDQPAYNACLLVTLIQILNMGAFMKLFIKSDKKLLDQHAIAPLAIAFCVITLSLNYFFLFRNKDVIVNAMTSLPKDKLLRTKYLSTLYVFGSIAAFVFIILT